MSLRAAILAALSLTDPADKPLTDEQITNAFASKVTELKNQLTTEKGKVTDLTNQLTAEKEKVTDLTNQLTAEKGKVTELTSQLTAEKGKVTDLTSQLTDEKGKVSDLTAAKNKATGKLERLARNGITAEKDAPEILDANKADPLALWEAYCAAGPAAKAEMRAKHGDKLDEAAAAYDAAKAAGR